MHNKGYLHSQQCYTTLASLTLGSFLFVVIVFSLFIEFESNVNMYIKTMLKPGEGISILYLISNICIYCILIFDNPSKLVGHLVVRRFEDTSTIEAALTIH